MSEKDNRSEHEPHINMEAVTPREDLDVPLLIEQVADGHQHHDENGSAGSWIAILAFLLAILLGAAVYYLWDQQQFIKKQLNNDVVSSLVADVRALDGKQQQLQEKLQTALSQYHEQQQQLVMSQQSMQQQLQGRVDNDVNLIEAESLLRLALNRYMLVRDIATSLLAMQMADRQLQSFSQPALVSIRQKIATEMNALQAIQIVDISSYLNELGVLIDMADRLPLMTARAFATPVDNKAVAGGWGGKWQDLINTLRPMLTIRRNSRATPAMLSNEEDRLVRIMLKSRLEYVRQALMQKDDVMVAMAVKDVRQWLNLYFDHEHVAVQRISRVLDGLEKISVNVVYPAIGDALKQLVEFRSLVPPQEPLQVQPQEPLQVPPQEPLQVQPQEPLQVPPQEPLQVPPQEPLQVPPQEPLQVPPQEPLQVPPQEPLQVPPQEPLQVPPQEPLQGAQQ